MNPVEQFKRYLQQIGCGSLFGDTEIRRAVESVPANQLQLPHRYTFSRAMRVYFSKVKR